MILPSPTASFEWVETAHGPRLVCRPLESFAAHLFTTRHWRLGVRTAADEAAWDDVAAALDVDARRLVRVRQVHGTGVAIAREDLASSQEADIVVSNDPAFAPAIRVADCVPLLIADRRTGAVAAAHAGWRGLAARVPEVTVAALARVWGSRPDDLVAAAGPSIGPCCYEVGADVRAAFERAGFMARDLERWFLPLPAPTPQNPSLPGIHAGRAAHWFFDAWASTRAQLTAAGLAPSQIFVAEICTASHSEAMCSYRRDGAVAGRLAAAIRPVLPRT